MSNATSAIYTLPYGKEPRKVVLPMDGGASIFQGTMVSQLTSTAMAVPGSTASSGPAVGVASHDQDNAAGSDSTLRVELLTDGIFLFANGTSTDACSEATKLFSVVYMGDDHTVFDNSNGSTLQPAGRFCGMEPDGRVRVFIGMANLGDSLADASAVAIADAGTFTAATDVETALQEIYQQLLSVQRDVEVPSFPTGGILAAGTPMAAWADNAGASAPGVTLTSSESVGIRWNNFATQTAVWYRAHFPQNVDDAAVIVMHAMASKIGATLDNATTFTVTAFVQAPGTLHNADSNIGGATSAMTGDATSLTSQEVTLTLAAAEIPAAPFAISFSIKPTDGTLDDDDVLLEDVWFEIKSKLVAS